MFERGKLGVSSMCEIKTKEKERDDVCRLFGVDFERRRGRGDATDACWRSVGDHLKGRVTQVDVGRRR